MARQVMFRGRKIEVAVDTATFPNGQTVQRDIVLHPGAVAVLPLIDKEHVCLLRNYRFVLNETLWEIPAGTLEKGEEPDHAARRELAEETGYAAGSWRKLAAIYPSPGVLSEIIYLYVAQDLEAGVSHPEPGESLEARVVAWKDAVAWALDGTIRDAKTITVLLLWDRLRSGA